MIENLHKSLVYGQTGVINRDWEGEIKAKGDSVKINALGPVTIFDVVKNADITAAETLSYSATILLVDQQKGFNFQIDDIDRAQQTPKVMDAAMREAAYAMKDTIDQYIAGLYTGVVAANLIGTTASPKTDLATAGYPYAYLCDLSTLLDEANIPSDGRWVVVPPFFHGLLRQDVKFVGYGGLAASEVLRAGVIGEAAGFKILVSNNVPKATATTKFRIIAGVSSAFTFAEQITSVEAYRPQLRFADAIKGLTVYGGKLIRPDAWAVLTANRP
jgi:hypothetical protein